MGGNRWDWFSCGKRVGELYAFISTWLLSVGVGEICLVLRKECNNYVALFVHTRDAENPIVNTLIIATSAIF